MTTDTHAAGRNRTKWKWHIRLRLASRPHWDIWELTKSQMSLLILVQMMAVCSGSLLLPRTHRGSGGLLCQHWTLLRNKVSNAGYNFFFHLLPLITKRFRSLKGCPNFIKTMMLCYGKTLSVTHGQHAQTKGKISIPPKDHQDCMHSNSCSLHADFSH